MPRYSFPGYYVFLDMAKQIERVRGKQELLKLVKRPPSEFVLAYEESAAKQPRLPHFSKAAMEIIRSLDAAERRAGG